MIKVLHIILDDLEFPHLKCQVTGDRYDVTRESVYDTAYSNFEVVVQNALRVKLRELLDERKNVPEPEPPKKPAKKKARKR